MSNTIQPAYGTAYSLLAAGCGARRAGTQDGSFLALARTGGSEEPESTGGAGTSNLEAYMEHLKSKYGRVTIENVGKDQASLEKAGRRMSGSDVVIAPNILEEMADDPGKAAFYEQKIDYFFTDVIPKGAAFAASVGLTFEPCGVVVHEDGTVTYICGGGDPPERVAEVNRINAEKARKKAEQQKQYQEQSAAAAAQRRAMWERTAETAAEKSFSNIGDLLKARMASAPAAAPEAPFPALRDMFFIYL